ncbi:hypothetical protein [Streptomyces carpinensis]|uniref:Lipoprotein n=1 Tax=Streptomyces carpinensis TaxID=66369 RepID=A0ABV1VUH4_9ACTN|nr:hypothetical protein [Streptomyces carpinensis]
MTAVLTGAAIGGATAVSTPQDVARIGSLRLAATAGCSVTSPPRSVAAQWVKTTDAPSGITVKLPGRTKVVHDSITLNGKTFQLRMYVVRAGKNKAVFQVTDMHGADTKAALDPAIRGIATSTKGTVSRDQPLKVAGHPAREGRITFDDKGVPRVVLIRYVAAADHLVGLGASGPAADEKGVKQLYQQLTGSLHIP